MLGVRVLLVNDNGAARAAMQGTLESNGFEVVPAANVSSALMRIAVAVRPFDVLLSDVQRPRKGGLIIASAMLHSNPKAITLVMSRDPSMSDAAAALVLRTDRVLLLLKPLEIVQLIHLIREKLANRDKSQTSDAVEAVATILEDTSPVTIEHWLERVKASPDLSHLTLTDKERTGHLPMLIQGLARRLRQSESLEHGRIPSTAAVEHGALRLKQKYTAAMIVEESRMLQVSLFQTLQENLHKMNFNQVLLNVMVIADEVDWQLTQTIRSFLGEPQSLVAALSAS